MCICSKGTYCSIHNIKKFLIYGNVFEQYLKKRGKKCHFISFLMFLNKKIVNYKHQYH